jgi:hypothetical protein|tara:strand:+ start:819 stop:1088 length:270 start_codon:yes stop_codon:yes gene_type:complete
MIVETVIETGSWWISITKAKSGPLRYLVELIYESEEGNQEVAQYQFFKTLSKAMTYAEHIQEENFDATNCGILLYGFRPVGYVPMEASQ